MHKVIAWNTIQVPIPEEARKLLVDIYRDDIQDLEKLLNRDLSPWLKY